MVNLKRDLKLFITCMLIVAVIGTMYLTLHITLTHMFTNPKITKEVKAQNTQNLKSLAYKSNMRNNSTVKKIFENFNTVETILYKSIKVDENKEQIIIETTYDSDELTAKINSQGILDLESYNKFLKETEFDPSPVLYSPTELIRTKKGNCYAYTLLTMYFLDRFYPEVKYEIITEQYPSGGSHIYLKIIGSEEDIICDLTLSPILELP